MGCFDHSRSAMAKGSLLLGSGNGLRHDSALGGGYTGGGGPAAGDPVVGGGVNGGEGAGVEMTMPVTPGQAPVAPVEPVEPVEPVAPVEPVGPCGPVGSGAGVPERVRRRRRGRRPLRGWQWRRRDHCHLRRCAVRRRRRRRRRRRPVRHAWRRQRLLRRRRRRRQRGHRRLSWQLRTQGPRRLRRPGRRHRRLRRPGRPDRARDERSVANPVAARRAGLGRMRSCAEARLLHAAGVVGRIDVAAPRLNQSRCRDCCSALDCSSRRSRGRECRGRCQAAQRSTPLHLPPPRPRRPDPPRDGRLRARALQLPPRWPPVPTVAPAPGRADFRFEPVAVCWLGRAQLTRRFARTVARACNPAVSGPPTSPPPAAPTETAAHVTSGSHRPPGETIEIPQLRLSGLAAGRLSLRPEGLLGRC